MNTQEARETFTQYLKKGNYRITPERFRVLDAVIAKSGHFDADELFLNMRSEGSMVSRATVYNTLDLLLECGIVSRYRFGENHARYEKTFGIPQHHHLICTECGNILEFTSGKIEKIQAEVSRQMNFKATSHSLQIFGICEKCQSEKA
jgi:Fur family ferric uptake transcriptional regulator